MDKKIESEVDNPQLIYKVFDFNARKEYTKQLKFHYIYSRSLESSRLHMTFDLSLSQLPVESVYF